MTPVFHPAAAQELAAAAEAWSRVRLDWDKN
jgi:hypothetical protein